MILAAYKSIRKVLTIYQYTFFKVLFFVGILNFNIDSFYSPNLVAFQILSLCSIFKNQSGFQCSISSCLTSWAVTKAVHLVLNNVHQYVNTEYNPPQCNTKYFLVEKKHCFLKNSQLQIMIVWQFFLSCQPVSTFFPICFPVLFPPANIGVGPLDTSAGFLLA